MRSASRLVNGSPAIPSSTGGIARLACARLRAANVDVAPIILQAGLTVDDIEDRTRRIDARSQIRILELAAEALRDDCFGFHLARDFELKEIGLVFYVMASSERLIDAFNNAARYSSINNDGVRLRTSAEGGFSVGIDYFNVDRLSDRHHIEFWLVTLVRICRALTDGRLAPKHVTVRHSRPTTPADMRSLLGCDVTFAAAADAVLFPARFASMAVVGADAHLNTLLLRYADEALSNRSARRGSLRSRVEDQIVMLLPHNKARAADVARRLGMSRSTLSRALGSEGASYLDVLDSLRQALAHRHLADHTLTISEIAWHLGYSEVSSFSHAFVRWTGVTPNAYRRSRHRK